MQAEKEACAVCPMRSTEASQLAQTVLRRRFSLPDIVAVTLPRMSCEEEPNSNT